MTGFKLFGVVVDKSNLHLAMDLDEELVELAGKLPEPLFKKIITYNPEETEEMQEGFDKIKKALFGGQKALIIQLDQ